jgi:VanZ family protein
LHPLQQLFAPISERHTVSYYTHIALGLLFMLAILAGLQAAPRRSRKIIIAVFTFLGGLYFVTEFFWPTNPATNSNPLTPFEPLVASIAAVVGSFAIGLGVVSLVQLHSRNIARRRSGWGFSAVLLVSFAAMFLFGLLNAYSPGFSVIPAVPGVWASQNAHGLYQFLFVGGLSSLTSATFSIIAFYIASAAYRAFRIRSLEATLLMAAALIVMLGSVSFGTWFTHNIPPTLADGSENPWANFRIENIAQWLLLEVNTAAQRGILFGLTLGLLATSLRYWLSLERGAYFDKEL